LRSTDAAGFLSAVSRQLLQPVYETLHLFDMKNWLLVLSFFFSLSAVQAATYYFSTSAGNDNRTAAEAQNASTPGGPSTASMLICAVLVPATLYFSAVAKFSMAP
jgi:hypothetical protein